MLTDVMRHYGFVKDFRRAGYFETEQLIQLFKDVKVAISTGNLVVISGIVGSGKTTALRHLFNALESEGKILVSKSLSVEKNRATTGGLISALFYDLSKEKKVKVPTQGERRERELRELIKKWRKPVAFFVDEAHDLNNNTLTQFKRLIEVVEDSGSILSIVLAGHPKLKNNLRRPTMEEIGSRSAIFTLDAICNHQKEYIQWLITQCVESGSKIENLLEPEALEMLSNRLKTPLQIQQHLTLAFEEAFILGESCVTTTIIEAIMSKQIDDLEPRLRRHGYSVGDLAEQFNAKPAEIKSMFRGQLDPIRTKELHEHMLLAGLPLLSPIAS
jgi:type II secretory pathway predicted ATPase ExeA